MGYPVFIYNQQRVVNSAFIVFSELPVEEAAVVSCAINQ